MILASNQIIWLKQHGGRGIEHVKEDANGKYILLYSPVHGEAKEYLPPPANMGV